jgi:hypothetical protein
VWGRGACGRRGLTKKIKLKNMVDGLHILIQNRIKKLLAIVLIGTGRGQGGEKVGLI